MAIHPSNTGSGHDNLIRQEVWSKRIQEELEEALMAQQLMEWVTDFGDGVQLNIPKLSSLTTRDYTDGDPITVDDPTVSEFTLTIDKDVQSGIAIRDSMRQDTFYMEVLNTKFPQQTTRAILERLENDIFLLHEEQTTNDANTINGQAHRFDATGTSQVITLADFHQAKLSLDKANVSKVGRKAYVDPTVINTLMGLDNIIRQDVYGANSHLKEGFSMTTAIGRYAGFDIFESNMLDESTQLDHATAGGSEVANLFVGPEAFIGAMRLAPEMEVSRDWERKQDIIHSRTRYGLGLYRPEALVCVLTA
jgi:hypothetical protein